MSSHGDSHYANGQQCDRMFQNGTGCGILLVRLGKSAHFTTTDRSLEQDAHLAAPVILLYPQEQLTLLTNSVLVTAAIALLANAQNKSARRGIKHDRGSLRVLPERSVPGDLRRAWRVLFGEPDGLMLGLVRWVLASAGGC